MQPDIKNGTTATVLIPAKSQTNNTGAGGVDLDDYVGTVAVHVNIGVKTAGDADGAISVRVATAADNNISNATNYGTSTIATTNATANSGDIAVDVRDANKYIFAIPTVTGTNSPAYPLSVVLRGVKRVQ
jgi:hypothetical protein